MRLPRPTPDPGASARTVAFDLLGAVLGRKRPLDEAVDAHPALPALAARDRAFTRQMVSTTLRRLGQIDILIDHCLERPLPAKVRAVRDILRLGVCQLLFLGTPPHAAVATTVELAQHTGHGPCAAPVPPWSRRRRGAACPGTAAGRRRAAGYRVRRVLWRAGAAPDSDR